MDGGGPTWRSAEPGDAPFLYRLFTDLDPRWWRLSKHGTAPARALETVREYAAMVVFHDDAGQPCGIAGLAEVAASSSTAVLDLLARPDEHAQEVMRVGAEQAVSAAFLGAPIRHLYHERFDDDPDLLTEMSCWVHEVTLPEFALVDGRFADRLTFGLSRAEFDDWQAARA